jgi:hypothetical protein
LNDHAQQIKLINQALAAAAASIELSKQLLAELSGLQKGVTTPPAGKAGVFRQPSASFTSSSTVPGTVGIFDGENLVTEKGTKHPVPGNYASKTLLVCGDRLKMIDGSSSLGPTVALAEANGKIFKQIERVKRQRINGTVSQRENGWYLTAPEGSYRVLEASILHFGAKVGDTAVGIIPKENKRVPFAALEGVGSIKNVETGIKPEEPLPSKKASEVKETNKLLVVGTGRGANEAKVESNTKKVPTKVIKISEAGAKPTKAVKKEEAPVKVLEPEKVQKKNEPVISDDDLR